MIRVPICPKLPVMKIFIASRGIFDGGKIFKRNTKERF